MGDGAWFEIVNIERSSMWQFPGRFMPHSLQVAQEHSVSGPTCRAGNDLRIEPRHVGITTAGFEKWHEVAVSRGCFEHPSTAEQGPLFVLTLRALVPLLRWQLTTGHYSESSALSQSPPSREIRTGETHLLDPAGFPRMAVPTAKAGEYLLQSVTFCDICRSSFAGRGSIIRTGRSSDPSVGSAGNRLLAVLTN
jgi:hypothetical protein